MEGQALPPLSIDELLNENMLLISAIHEVGLLFSFVFWY
jgi:hypothetical protein